MGSNRKLNSAVSKKVGSGVGLQVLNPGSTNSSFLICKVVNNMHWISANYDDDDDDDDDDDYIKVASLPECLLSASWLPKLLYK